MSWNDPDDNDRDPWGNRRNDDGPPDLDEVVRKMQEKLGGLFGGRGGSDGGDSNSAENRMIFGVFGVLILAYLSWDMVYRIDQVERGVVMRFGQYVTTLQPGPHIRFPRPIEEVVKVNVERIQTLTADSVMLTGDENIVDVELAMQYRVNDPKSYLFLIADPDVSVQRVTESAIRDIIGQSTLDFVITEGRAEIATGAQSLIQSILDTYESGIEITSVNMQPAKPPEQVKAAFDDAIKAREDEQRKINEAEAYRNEVVERAAGEAARIRLDAEGYKERVISQAEGEASRFNQLLTEYEKAPQVTRRRLYLEAIEEVMSDTTKVIMDNDGGS
ncbi:MAG: FtsH protease activity modulator HflK, partial [Gammaproteobacteria bacterium]